ncbi:MAG: CPBP family intramembrane glutamic endopeptidase [Clostridiaceae bacterium]
MIFINKESQVRSGWKIFITLLVGVILTFLLGLLSSVVYSVIKITTNNDSTQQISDIVSVLQGDKLLNLIMGISQCLAIIISVVIFWKVFEKKPIRMMGLTSIFKSYKDLLHGLAFGAVSMIVVFLILLGTKSISMENAFSNPNFSTWIIIDFIMFIFVGINEEMFARGYCMSVLKQTKNKYAIVCVSSVIFSVMHSLNPHMSILSYINLFLVGVLFAYMFIKANNIWLPIGYHITWNFFQGDIFGFQVSGTVTNGLYGIKSIGNDLITGGEFGPEGGLVVTLIIVLGFIYMRKLYRGSNDNAVELF